MMLIKKIAVAAATLIMSLAALPFAACSNDSPEGLKKEYARDIEKEMKGSFNFFWNEASLNETAASGNLPTYGLIADRFPNVSNNASIASVGYGLTAYAIGAKEGYVTKEEAQTRAEKTLETLLVLQKDGDVAHEGFFAHFIDMKTGKRSGTSEISTIDTAILLCGALTAGEYFGENVKTLANELYSGVNWKSMEHVKGGKTYITMGYSQEKKSLLGDWDWYAEQLMLYVLGAGSPKTEYRLDDKAYYDFKRQTGKYNDNSFIYSWFGSIFTYQFSHAWIDFNGIKDKNGTDWYQNSVAASNAAYEYCRDNKTLKTFSEGGWGLTACDAPGGYSGHLGNIPRGWSADAAYYAIEGTVAPCGAIGSTPFTPKESLKALRYYQSLERLNGRYGLSDAYNLDYKGREWYASDSIGIDKGISIMMLSNFKDRGVWDITMKNPAIKLGLENLGFTAA